MATHSNILAWEIPWTEDWWAAVLGITKRLNTIVSKCPDPPTVFKKGVAWPSGAGWLPSTEGSAPCPPAALPPPPTPVHQGSRLLQLGWTPEPKASSVGRSDGQKAPGEWPPGAEPGPRVPWCVCADAGWGAPVQQWLGLGLAHAACGPGEDPPRAESGERSGPRLSPFPLSPGRRPGLSRGALWAS